MPTFLPCFELGLQVNHHDIIPCFSCELAAMRHVSLPKKWEPGTITWLNMLWTQGSVYKLVITRSIRWQEHHQCLYFHVLVLRSRNARELIEQKTSNDSCFILPRVTLTAFWPYCSLTKNSFLYSFFKGGLWITSAQLTVSWDPEMPSFVLSFCPFSPIRFIKQST